MMPRDQMRRWSELHRLRQVSEFRYYGENEAHIELRSDDKILVLLNNPANHAQCVAPPHKQGEEYEEPQPKFSVTSKGFAFFGKTHVREYEKNRGEEPDILFRGERHVETSWYYSTNLSIKL